MLAKEEELDKVEQEIRSLSAKQEQFITLKQQLEIKQHESKLLTQNLQQTSHYRMQEEIGNLETEIGLFFYFFYKQTIE